MARGRAAAATSSPFRSRRMRVLLSLAAAAAAAVCLVAAGPLSGASVPSGVAEAFHSALDDVAGMRTKVGKGLIVQNFGKKANKIVASVGSSAPEVEQALDGALQSLFLQQLAVLRQKLFNSFKGSSGQLAAVLSKADRAFVAGASRLLRPGSEWSFESDRVALQHALALELASSGRVAQERFRVAQTQRATADVIGKLQKQMETMGEKVRGTSAGSPWVLWTSYRLPGTPFQVSGRYQEGRTNIELNLSPNMDPVNAEAGMVEPLFSNLGLSFNIGM
mmetsp:Transcript_60419/g.153538  ORF Transcript_60419/g.153538 Transcript_60419/m.153538 type:complete len:278 (-) Transcript_60419:130-963(-)